MIRGVRLAAIAAVVLGLAGATRASATPVSGQVVCKGTDVGVSNVTVAFERDPDWREGATDATGSFVVLVPYVDGISNVWLDTGSGIFLYGPVDIASQPFTFEVEVPGCTPPPPPPPPSCPELEELTEGPFCLSKPLGNPKRECGALGLVPVYKDDNLSGVSYPASTAADVALVKSGNCYNLVIGVAQGEPLSQPYAQSISHVTYCACPAP